VRQAGAQGGASRATVREEPIAHIGQQTHQPQFFDLIGRIEPVAMLIAQGCGKPVALFPDPQDVPRQAGLAFGLGDGEGGVICIFLSRTKL
jgi:hypothetical protein